MRTDGLARGRRLSPECEAAVVEALAVAWRWRLELALLGAAAGLQRLLAARLGEVGAVVVVLVLAAVVVAVAPARRLLWRVLRRAWLRRAWAGAATDVGLAAGPLRVPRVLGATRIPAGDLLRVRVLRGQSVLRLPLQLVVVDELAFYLSMSDRRLRQEFAERLRDLVARGRAAGVIVVVATQKPGADVVPTALRDLFGFRLALRCNTPQASDTILGQGWASTGSDASTIPGGQRGVGYLLAEEERPARIKTFHLSDDEIGAIVERAAARRADAWLAAATRSGRERDV